MRKADFPSLLEEGLGKGKGDSLEEIMLQLTLNEIPSLPKKILFCGEGAEKVASYVAGWMAGRRIGVVVLDGANRFDPYIVSIFARRALIPPEKLLKKIQIARAFTCYQMATLMGERLFSFVKTISTCPPNLSSQEPLGERNVSTIRDEMVRRKPWVIILGPITPFSDEDVPEREIYSLFERALSKIEKMAVAGMPFFLFQPPVPPGSRGSYLMRRLAGFSNWVWRISLENQGPKMILEKGLYKHQIPNTNVLNNDQSPKTESPPRDSFAPFVEP